MGAAVDLFTADFIEDPYAVYRRLPRTERVHWTTAGLRAVSGYEDCVRVLSEPGWSVDPGRVDEVRRFFAADDTEEPGPHPLTRLDPPEHTAIRRLIGPLFTPRELHGVEASVRRLVDQLLDDLAGRPAADLVADFALPLAVRTINDLLGVPREHEPAVVGWSTEVARKMDLAPPAPEAADRRRQAAGALHDLLRGLARRRRAQPGPDLLSAMAAAEVDGRRLTDDEIAANSVLLMMAGQETTLGLLGNGALALLREPAQRERLREEPAIEAAAIEELLRYDPPVHMRPRVAVHDVRIGETAIREGEQVLVLLAAANRDPRVFDAPDVLDLGRRENRHLSFGMGRHVCLGAGLARLEARIALPRLVRRFPDLALAPGPPERERNVVHRRLARLPVTLSRARAAVR